MTSPGRRWGRLPVAAIVALGAVAAASGGAPVRGQEVPTTTTTASTQPPSEDPPPPEQPETTTPPSPEATPPGDPSPPPGAPPPTDPVPRPGPSDQPSAPREPQGDGAVRPQPGEVPRDVRRVISSVRRSAPNGTARLLAALAPLEQLGMTREEAIGAGFGRFPVAGIATFSHDWLFPRYTPSFHLHLGTDIFAVTGTPVRSPADGVLKLAQGGSGGLAAYVYQADGTYYYMAHLSAFAGHKQGARVTVGELVGYVGDSGNAKGSSPHVHFEIHPAPTRAISSGTGRNRTITYVARPVPVGTVLPAADPKATLDQWLRDALAGVPRLVAALESRPRALVATGVTRRLADGRTGSFPGPVAPPETQLLWASSVNPSGGALRLAESEALVAATEFNWAQASRRQQALRQEQADAAARAAAILDPITPSSLRTSTAAD